MTLHSEFPVESLFTDVLGIRFLRAENGKSELTLTLKPHHMNDWGIAHGGVIMTLLDSALAVAARSAATAHTGIVTIEMKTNFMQPGQGCLHAWACVLHKSATLAYCEGEVRDHRKALIAKALGTFKYVRKIRPTH